MPNQGVHPSLRYFLALFLAAVVARPAMGAPDSWMESYDRLLKKYATPGGVRYAAWKGNAGDLQELRGVVDAIGTARGFDEQE